MARRKRKTSIRRRGMFGTGTRGRRILTWLLAVAAALVLLCIIAFYQFLSWLQGDSFRKQLEGILANRAQASRVLIPRNLSIDNELLSLPSVTLQRNDALQQASANRLMASVDRSQLYSRRLLIRKLTMEEASLRLDAGALGGKLPPIIDTTGGFWSRFAPRTMELKALECADTDTSLILNGATYNLQGFSLSAAPRRHGNATEWHLTLENGRLHTPLPYLQNCSIKTASLLCTKDATMLSECRMMLSPGELRARGSFQHSNTQWYLDLKANKANVARLLNSDWKKRLTGELYGELRLTGTGNTLKEAAGQISLQQGMLEGLPILSQIRLENTRPYRSMELEKAECHISYPFSQARHNIRNAWLFDRIDLRARNGMLRVKGHVIVAQDGTLRGTLTLGLPDSLVNSFTALQPRAAEKIFNASGDPGFHWVNINISGTTDAPREDLSARLSTILTSQVVDAARNTTSKAAATLGTVVGGLFAGSKADTPDTPEPEKTPDKPDTEAPSSGLSPTDVLDILF